MTFSVINVGTLPNDGTGNPLRNAMIFVNDNFEIVKNNFQSQVTEEILDDRLDEYVLTATYSAQISSLTASQLSLSSSLDNKAPLVHTHSISQVDGLQTQLDSKVSTTNFNSQITSINSTISTLANTKLNDAPSDGEQYVRQDGEWVISSGGGTSSVDYKVLIKAITVTSPSDIDIDNIFQSGIPASSFFYLDVGSYKFTIPNPGNLYYGFISCSGVMGYITFDVIYVSNVIEFYISSYNTDLELSDFINKATIKIELYKN